MFADSFGKIPFFFFKGLYDFIYFWYVRSSIDFWRKELDFVRSVEREMGLIINIKLITQPIFGDYSYMGRFLGPIFRIFRIISSFIILFVACICIILMYFIWVLLPVLVSYMFFSNLFYVIIQ